MTSKSYRQLERFSVVAGSAPLVILKFKRGKAIAEFHDGEPCKFGISRARQELRNLDRTMQQVMKERRFIRKWLYTRKGY